MPPAAAGDATASEHRGGGVRARRARRRRRAAAGGSAAVVDPRRRRAGVGVGRLAGAASPSESMGGPPDMGVYDLLTRLFIYLRCVHSLSDITVQLIYL